LIKSNGGNILMNNNKGLILKNTNANTNRRAVNSCATVNTQIQSLTEQNDVTPTVIVPAGPVYVKLPVILAETNITIPVEATITLDREIMEIKRIKKNVFLTQSRLMPFSPSPADINTGTLFISGFIRKNIEYATKGCTIKRNTNVCGDIRHCTVDVPFNFTTIVTLIRQPVFTQNTTQMEMEFFTDTLQGCDLCADPVIGRNPCDQSLSFTEHFNEKPFVELVSAYVTEVDIQKNPTFNSKNPVEQTFCGITEKAIINLTLKVLQKQQVQVSAL
jgi:hypothetical protein